MDKRASERVIERVIEFLEADGCGIDTATYEQLFRSISEALENVAECAGQYSELRRLTYAQRNYARANELEGFDIGACWATMKVVEAVERKGRDAEDRQQCLLLLEKYSRLFECIACHPGVTQGELASLLGKTPSNLSQVLSRVTPFRLIDVTICGRTKRYSLTPYAKRILEDRGLGGFLRNEENSATAFEIDEMPSFDDAIKRQRAKPSQMANSSPRKTPFTRRKSANKRGGMHRTMASGNANDNRLQLSA